jgi:hypothetical protein
MANTKRTRAVRTRGVDVNGKPRPKKPTRIARTHGALENLKNGRPTDYSDELLEVVRIMARGGATVFEIAHALKVTTQTLHNWAARHEGFFDALYREGKPAFDERIKRTLADRALGYSFESEKVFANGQRMKVIEHVPPDPGAMKLWLTNRDPANWSDKQNVDASINAKIETTGADDDRQLAMAVLALISKATRNAGGGS